MRKQTGSRNRGWLSAIGNRLAVAAGVALVAGMLAGTARAAATDYYVATNGLDTADGLSWATPLLTISNGVAKATTAGAGSTVTVSNGTYNIGASIAIGAGITVQSFGNGVTGGLANAANTVVQRNANNIRIFTITHASAVVQGLAITEGNVDLGGGVNMTGGLVRDCIIRNNNIGDNKSAGGVYMTGGTVSNCVIKFNSKANGTGNGGGIYALGGLIVNCQITDNSTGALDGGGVYLFTGGTGATLRNCFLARNTSAAVGGGVWVSSGTIENCTIVANSAGASGGGGIYRNSGTAGTIRNCIVLNNTSGHATYKNTYSTDTANWTYTCTTLPDVAGAGCTNGDPLFRNYAEGNYQLSAGSPCIDTGLDQGWMTGATDLAGNPRQQDIPSIGTASVDMGAYEYNSPLSCDFLASPRALIAGATTYQSFGPAPFTVQFTGWADGTNLTGLVYRWDFDNDGNYEQEGLNLTGVSYTYNTAGVYSPRLQVTNSTAEVAEKLKSAYVSAGNTHYVRTNSPGALAPYTSWATAVSNNIQAAINEAAKLNGSVVIVSNGTYNITASISIGKPITVRSFGNLVYGGLANASNTIVKVSGGSGNRTIFVVTADATVDGFTMRDAVRSSGTMLGGGAYVNASGAVVQNCIMTANNGDTMYGCGVYIDSNGGLVRNCTIRNNGDGPRIYGANVYMKGGTVSNCVITGGKATAGGGTGGGVYMTGGLLVSCNIYGNSDTDDGTGGGGVYMGGGTVRNCLITGNSSAPVGGGVYLAGGTIESSTIVTNSTSNASGGGGIYRASGTAGTVLNCIVYNNTAANSGTYKNFYKTADAGVTYTCTTLPDVAGTGCINGAPVFKDAANSDYRLKACAAVDSGANQTSWMTGALDLADSARIVNSIVDMGAYEYAPGALECGLAANVTTVLAPANVVFTATVVGSNLTSLAYTWTFGDGNSTNGAGLGVATNLYSTPGIYTVTLTITNGVGEVATATNVNLITAWGANAYVWTNSPSPAVPYTNWATAARLIGTAAAAAPAGVTLWATNGTYNETIENLINKRLTVRSVEGNLSGASNTIVRANAGGYRVFSLSDGNAVLQGLTIQDNRGAVNGCGVNMSAGLVRDCIIRNNGFGDNMNGGGVYMSGGTVSNCIVKANGVNSAANGGGIYATDGQIIFCQILDNTVGGDQGSQEGGGGVYLAGAALRNCLIARNATTVTAGGGNKAGGGVYLAAGTIENCTIVANSAVGANGGGGVYRGSGTAGTVLNSIVYNNTAANNATYRNFYSTSDAGVTYTCTTLPDIAGTGNITTDPSFKDLAGGDYRLNPTSLCIDQGSNQAWMDGALDLSGNTRITYGGVAGSRSSPVVDMGAYEAPSPPPRGTMIMLR